MKNEQQIYQKETSFMELNDNSVKVVEMSIRSRSYNKQSITREGEGGEDYTKPFSKILNPQDVVRPEDILY